MAVVTTGMMSIIMAVVGNWCDMRDGSMGHWSNVVCAVGVDDGLVMRNMSNNWSSMMVRDGGMVNWSHSVGSNMHWLSNNLVHWLSDLDVGWLTTDNSIESGVMIGMVVHNAVVAIGIDQTVLSMDLISVAGLVLALDISGVFIMHGIGEFVVSWSVVLDFLYEGVMDWSSMNGGHMVHWSCMDTSYMMHWSSMMELDRLMRRCVAV